MKQPLIVIGIGEMGGVFARGCLRASYPVYPVSRDMDIKTALESYPDPEAILVTVAENDLQAVLGQIPAVYHDRLVLVQNELLPRDWQSHNINQPTVISVWFEKKPGQDFKVLIPSPVFGPRADLVCTALESLNIPTNKLANSDELLFELVLKNVYILTTNICGLKTGGTVSELWQQHESLARTVAADVIEIQTHLTGSELDKDALIKGMLHAFDGDPDHKCMGRSASARLERAVHIANEADLSVPELRVIHTSVNC
jgi:hypothetical protein